MTCRRSTNKITDAENGECFTLEAKKEEDGVHDRERGRYIRGKSGIINDGISGSRLTPTQSRLTWVRLNRCPESSRNKEPLCSFQGRTLCSAAALKASGGKKSKVNRDGLAFIRQPSLEHLGSRTPSFKVTTCSAFAPEVLRHAHVSEGQEGVGRGGGGTYHRAPRGALVHRERNRPREVRPGGRTCGEGGTRTERRGSRRCPCEDHRGGDENTGES